MRAGSSAASGSRRRRAPGSSTSSHAATERRRPGRVAADARRGLLIRDETTIQLYRAIVGRMTLPHPLPDDLVELIARRLRVIGDPTRIRLLDHLRDGEATVNELAARLGAGQQNVSKH